MSTEYKNIIIAGVWPTKNGHFNTMPIDSKAFESLQKAFEQGGKFLIRKRTEESLAKSRNPDTASPYFLEFIPKDEVDSYQATRDRETRKGL